MYQLGGILKFLLILLPFFLFFHFQFPWPWMALTLPYFYFIMLFDSVKRGCVILKTIEWERGPFDVETLPLALRQYLKETSEFFEKAGFTFHDEGLSTFETFGFGQQEYKSLIRLFENPTTGEYATQSFAFSWSPANNRCRFHSSTIRLIGFGKDGLVVTANSQSRVREANGKGFQIQYVDEPNLDTLLKLHREKGAAPGKLSLSLAEYAQRTKEAEIPGLVGKGLIFEDPQLRGYRFTLWGTLSGLARLFAGKERRRGEIRGLGVFTWKIRPASSESLLRENVPSKEETTPEQRVAAFHIGFWSVARNRYYQFFSWPWLGLFLLLVSLVNLGTAYQFEFDFSWTHLFIFAAGFVFDVIFLAMLAAGAALLLPMGGGRYTERFGKRLLKFYGDVICYEGPHGVTTCVLGNFPEARKAGKGYWVKIPGIESFVVKPKQFEKEGFRVFTEEMAKKNLIRPSRRMAWVAASFVLSAAVLVWASLDTQYLKTPFGKRVQGLFKPDQAVIVVTEETSYTHEPKGYRWWMPSFYLATLFHADPWQAWGNRKLSLEVWWIGKDGLRKYDIPIQGDNLLNLTAIGDQVFLTTQQYQFSTKDYQTLYRFYRIGAQDALLLTDAEAQPNRSRLENTALVLDPGWKSLASEGWNEYEPKEFHLSLPGDCEFFSQPGKGKRSYLNDFGIRKNGQTLVFITNDSHEGLPTDITREEYETAIREMVQPASSTTPTP